MMQLPSLALMILRRAHTVGAPWLQLDAEGSRYTDAGRLLVALGLCNVVKIPYRFLAITDAGLTALADLDKSKMGE